MYVMYKKVDRLCGLVVRVPGYGTEIYCVSEAEATPFFTFLVPTRQGASETVNPIHSF
jgi:hypothetical protein